MSDELEPLGLILSALLQTPFFAASPHDTSFFSVIFPLVVDQLGPLPFPAPARQLTEQRTYSTLWCRLVEELEPAEGTTFFVTLLSFLDQSEFQGLPVGQETGQMIKAVAFILHAWLGDLVGVPGADSIIWTRLEPVLLDAARSWSWGLARVIGHWINSSTDSVGTWARLLAQGMLGWSAPEGILRASDAARQCSGAPLLSYLG